MKCVKMCRDSSSFCVTFGVLLMFLWNIQTGQTKDEYEFENVRTWTGWYDTDNPAYDGEDDERVTSLRKRGHQICNGLSPIDAVCRDVRQHALMFNSDSIHVTNDVLAVPCTTNGIMCRNSDQHNRTCRNYEIRYECLGAKDEAPPPNLGIIGVAAGLSVIVPIVCVAIMHVVRLCRHRRNHRHRHSLLPRHENSEQSSQTDITDLPPSYALLFPDSSSLHSQSMHDIGDEISNYNNSDVAVSLVAPAIDLSGNSNLASTRLNSGRISHLHDNVAVVQPLQGLATDCERSQHQNHQNNHMTSTWRSRFPNMHLSVFDLLMTSERTSHMTSERTPQHSTAVPPSPDPSYVQTPPPTYNEALAFLESAKSDKVCLHDTPGENNFCSDLDKDSED